MRICVFEDAGVAQLQPLSLTRPAFDLRCGAISLLERQLRSLSAGRVAVFVRPELAGLTRQAHPEVPVNERGWLAAPGDDLVVLVNARWLPPVRPPRPTAPEVGLVGEQVAYAAVWANALRQQVSHGLDSCVAGWRQEMPTRPASGVLIDYPWDLVEHNAAALEQDYRHWLTRREGAALPGGVSLVGPAERFIADPAARIDPLVVIDTRHGPVLVDRDAVVQAFSRLEGPCYVGPGTHVLAARVRGSSLGPQCRIGGEVEASVVHGHSNKAHEGFLGHAYVGEWINLGAGTHTSDLRNDYGTVTVWVAGRQVDTGLLKVGSFLGDHTKTSLNTLFNTGSVVGPFAQLVSSGALAPRVVPAFGQLRHGRLQRCGDLPRLFSTAAAMMARRGRRWTETQAEFFLALYESTTGEGYRLIRESEQRRLSRSG